MASIVIHSIAHFWKKYKAKSFYDEEVISLTAHSLSISLLTSGKNQHNEGYRPIGGGGIGSERGHPRAVVPKKLSQSNHFRTTVPSLIPHSIVYSPFPCSLLKVDQYNEALTSGRQQKLLG